MPLVTAILGILIAVATQSPPDTCRRAAEANTKGNLVAAESLLQQCLSENPADITPYLWLCALYQSQGRDAELHSVALRGLKRFPGEKRFYLTVGNRAGKEGQCATAVDVLSQGFKRWPQDSALRDNLAQALLCRGMNFLDEGDNAAAKSDLERVVELDPDNSEALLNLGRALHNLQQSGEALEVFDRAFELNPKAALVQFHRGVALSALGRFDEAIEALNSELRSAPGHAPSYYFRGVAYFYEGDWDRSFADLKTAVEGMPEFSDAVYRLGRCYDHFGMNEEAEAALRKSSHLDPSDVRPLYALGSLLSRTGREDAAQAMFKRAVDQYTAENINSEPGTMQFHSTRKSGLD
jgi:tetratricopeptide (TPR) repeat protein